MNHRYVRNLIDSFPYFTCRHSRPLGPEGGEQIWLYHPEKEDGEFRVGGVFILPEFISVPQSSSMATQFVQSDQRHLIAFLG